MPVQRPLLHRLSIGAALTAIAAVILASTALVTTALAAIPPNVTYVATQSSSDTMTLISDATGARFATIRTAPSGLTGCPEAVLRQNFGTLTPYNTFQGGSAVPRGNVSLWYFSGAVGDGGAIAGSVSLDFPVENASCTTRSTYLGEATQGATDGPALRPGRTYEGAAYSAINPFLRGPITITTGANPHVIDQLLIGYEEGACSYPIDMRDIVLTGGKMFQTGFSNADNPNPVTSVVGVTQGSNRLVGAFSVPGFEGCPAVAGAWDATLVALEGEPPPATPTPAAPPPTAAPTIRPATPVTTAVPAPSAQLSGTGTVSVRIPPTGIGLTIFAGGTNTQLTTASGCASLARAGFWASDGNGGFLTYVPASSIAIVNAAWNARFSAGIPDTTVIIARCS